MHRLILPCHLDRFYSFTHTHTHIALLYLQVSLVPLLHPLLRNNSLLLAEQQSEILANYIYAFTTKLCTTI